MDACVEATWKGFHFVLNVYIFAGSFVFEVDVIGREVVKTLVVIRFLLVVKISVVASIVVNLFVFAVVV